MSRRRKADKREILPDPKFGDLVLSKFMACLMINGKKYCAEKIVYSALDRIKEKSGTYFNLVQKYQHNLESDMHRSRSKYYSRCKPCVYNNMRSRFTFTK